MNKKSIAGVIALVAGFAIASTALAATITFSTNLKMGSKGADVKNLQVVLNADPFTQVAAAGAGSPGNESTYFGVKTKAAVIRFQNKHKDDVLTPVGLTVGTGFVGMSTRAKLNMMSGSVTTTTTTTAGCPPGALFNSMIANTPCATTTTTTTTTTTGPVSVALANDNPAASAVVAGQATADLAHFTFTGNGTLTNVKLMRTGISSNATLTNVYLYQGNTRVADSASVNNTDSTITFNNVNLVVNGSLTLSVRADILTGTAGQIIGVSLIGYTVTGGTMTTTSISGNYMSIAGAQLAAVAVGTQTAASSTGVNAGTMGYTFLSVPVTVSTRSVWFKGASFKFVGSAPTDAIQNLKLFVNGVQVGNSSSVSASGMVAFDLGATPLTLNTGSVTLELRGDIVKGSNRSATFSIDNSGDLMVMDSQLNVNVAVTGVPSTPNATINISTGTVTASVDPSFTSVTNVTGGASGATLAKFKLQAYGEDVKVSTLTITPALSTVMPTAASSTVAANGLNNVGLFYNGSQVGSSHNFTGAGQAYAFSLGSALILTAGTSGILEVRGDVQDAANASYTGGTVAITLAAGSSNGQGQSSSVTMSVPTGPIPGATLTVSTGALTLAKAPGYTDQVVNQNTPNVKIGSFVLQNTSTSESVRVTNLAVTLGGTATQANVANLRTSESATPVQPAVANNFPVNFTLASGATKNVDIFMDVNSVTIGNTIITTLTPTATGVSSNVNATPTGVAGQTITVQTGSLAVPTFVTNNSSVAQFVSAGNGAVDGSKAEFNFVATNGTANVTDLKFTVASSTGTPISSLRIGTMSAPVVAGVATFTGLTLSIPSGAAGAPVDVYATYSKVGINAASSSATSTISLTYMKYTIGGTTTSTSTLAVVSPAMTSVGSEPAVTVAQPTGAILQVSTGVEAIDVTITADAAGPIVINSFPISSTLNASGALFSSTTPAIVKDVNNNTIASTGTCPSAATCAITIALTNGYSLAAGQSQTFKVFLPVANIGTVSASAHGNSMYTNIATGTGFSWSDTAGNSTAAITGTTLFVNYPSTITSTVSN
jgi:hypothetical protein